MAIEPSSLPQLLRNRLRAEADVFAAVASHGTIVGTAREIALISFFRGLVPKRFEVLSGAIAASVGGKLAKAASQLDVMVVDTFEYPTLLRTGDLAIATPDSVRIVIESKSDLEKGQTFYDALEQIGLAHQLAGGGVLTALFCFAAPAKSATLREWLADMLTRRGHLLEWAELDPGAPSKDGTTRPKRYENTDKSGLLEVASSFSSANLPDLIVADKGAIAIRSDKNGRTLYEFYKTDGDTPSLVALASKALVHLSTSAAPAGVGNGFRLLIDHYDAAIVPSGDPSIDVTDPQPGS